MTRAMAIAALAAAALARPAAAQVVEVPSADLTTPRASVVTPQPSLGLADAVNLAVRNSPQIRRAAEQWQAATGRYQQSRGLFDLNLRIAPGFTVTRQQMTPFLLSREIGKRETIQLVADEFTALTVVLRQMIENTPTDPVRCPSNLSFDLGSTLLDRRDPTELAVLGVSRDLFSPPAIELKGLPTRGQLTDSGVASVLDLGDICETPVEPFFSPEAFGGAIRQIDQSGGLGLGGVLESVSQIPREVRRLQEQIARTVALRAKLTLDKLGPVPTDDLQLNFTGDAGVSKLFRNGLFAELGYQTQSQEHNFIDKPLDPAYGGLGLPDQFYSQIGGRLTIPLLRGFGSTATAGAERAARYVAEAAHDELRHAVSEEVFRTVLAYLNVVAARETLDVLEQSGARQQQIFTFTQQRVAGGDLAGIELNRVQARQARVGAAIAQARVALDEARLALADTMGVSVAALDAAPRATDTLATAVAAVPDAVALMTSARDARLDARAARERRQASSLLAAAARANARPQLDLTLAAGMSNFYDSPLFRFIEDGPDAIKETRPVPIDELVGAPGPPKSPVRYYDPRGFYRALTGRYEPFATVTVTWQLPFGNNSARGRAAQAAATLESSSIQVTDLHRAIDERLLAARTAVARGAAAVQRATEAVQADAQLLDSAMQLLQSGDQTIIDTLLTEEGITGDQLQLVRRRQAYLSALARLRFEAASLVTVADPGTNAERFRFEPGAFVEN